MWEVAKCVAARRFMHHDATLPLLKEPCGLVFGCMLKQPTNVFVWEHPRVCSRIIEEKLATTLTWIATVSNRHM